MKRFLRFIPLCFACLYPSIAMAGDLDGLELAIAYVFAPLLLIVLLFSSIIFTYIPYFYLKSQFTKKRFPYWLHHLFCAPILMSPLIYLCLCIERVTQDKSLVFIFLLVGFLIYLGIHKLITFFIHLDTSKALRILIIINRVVDIIYGLFAFLTIISIISESPEDVLTISFIYIVPFVILLIIQKKIFTKLLEMYPYQNIPLSGLFNRNIKTAMQHKIHASPSDTVQIINTVYSVQEIRTRLEPVFLKYSVVGAFVFGAYAQSNTEPDSEVDILFEGELDDLAVNALLQEIADALGKDINLLDARKIDPNSDREIKKNSIQIYEQA